MTTGARLERKVAADQPRIDTRIDTPSICQYVCGMTERTTVRLPEELLNRARRKAAAEGRTLTSLIEDGLRLVMAQRGSAAKKKRIMPPVSKATGGPMPGVDVSRFSALEEMDDLEYVERMKHFK